MTRLRSFQEPAETVGPSDFLPGSAYKLADGTIVQSDRFRARTLELGNTVFRDVPASISAAGTPLLLGQGVLSRLGAWSIDNRRDVLLLGEGTSEKPSASLDGLPRACTTWQTARRAAR